MKCYLMNRENPVAMIEYDTDLIVITKIHEIYDMNSMPLRIQNSFKDKSKNSTKELNNWFKGRGIPSWRKDLKRLLDNLNIEFAEELLDKAYGLSLSDQYWFKSVDDKVRWEDINFFDNDFEFEGFLTASFSDSIDSSQINKESYVSPNNTTDGMLQKAWIIENNKRILIKGTYTASRQEPINEWLSSQICKRLGFDYCNYEVDHYKENIVSKCLNFLNNEEEIVPACDLFESKKKDNNTNDYEHYINILEDLNIPDVRENLENMFIIDYLVMNEDRHLRNFGAIRNVITGKYEKLTPIFDTGQSMQCSKLTNNMNFYDGQGKFFYNTNKSFSSYPSYIKDITRIDLSKLDGLNSEYEYMLKKFQKDMDMTDQRVDKLINGFTQRVNELSKHIHSIKLEQQEPEKYKEKDDAQIQNVSNHKSIADRMAEAKAKASTQKENSKVHSKNELQR